MMDTGDRAVDPRLVEELRSLARTYASGVDRRDRDQFLSSFHEDATLTVVRTADATTTSPRTMSGHGEIGRVIDAIAIYSSTFHFLGQSGYARTESGTTGEVSCVAHHRWTDGVELDHVMYIRYADEYRIGHDDRWRIARRTVQIDWSETRTVEVPGRTAR